MISLRKISQISCNLLLIFYLTNSTIPNDSTSYNTYYNFALSTAKKYTNKELIALNENKEKRERFLRLRSINLSQNHLTEIPVQLQSSKYCKSLNLRDNKITQIPSRLTGLIFLNVSINLLTSINEEICQMVNLEYLDLSKNKIENTPIALDSLKKLQFINLSYNLLKNVSKFPKNLSVLNLNRNFFKDFPEHICCLENLHSLKLNSNFLFKLPNSFVKLQSLEIIDLSHNYFGEIPKQVYELTNLRFLNANFLRLTTIDARIKNLKNLQTLKIEYNKIMTLPEQICQLTNLQNLHLKNNRLQKLPVYMDYLINLQYFDCSYNDLKYLPRSFIALKNLKILKCNNNNISSLNLSFGALHNVNYIDFGFNRIKYLPDSLQKLINLNSLNLQMNRILKFTINCERLLTLNELNLSNNFLADFENICSIKNLKVLFLSNNQITFVHKKISELQELTILDLSDNQIFFLPKEIKQCKKLKKLNLKNNNLSKIPNELFNFLCNLDKLDIRQNSINFFGTLTDKGAYDLFNELGTKLILDNRNTNYIVEVILFWKNKPIKFNFDMLKKCRPLKIPSTIYLEEDLNLKINFFLDSILKNNNFDTSSKTKDTLNFEEIYFNTRILINYIHHLYNSNEACYESKIIEEKSIFLKQLISAIVFKLFIIDNIYFIETQLNFLSEAVCSEDNGLIKLIYFYKILIVNEELKEKKNEICSQNERIYQDTENYKIKANSQFIEQKPNFLNLRKTIKRIVYLKNYQNGSVVEKEEKNLFLNAYIEYSIKILVGYAKMKIFTSTFLNFKISKKSYSLDKWKFLLKDYIGIEINQENSDKFEEEINEFDIAFGLHAFFKQFTFDQMIPEIKFQINRDIFLIERIKEYLSGLNIQNIMRFFESKSSNINNITGVSDDFCWYILRELDILNKI